MTHYFITNRQINSDKQGEFINEDGKESAGENMRCGTFDSSKYKPKKKNCRESIVLFPDADEVDRTEAVNQPLPALYAKSDLKAPMSRLKGSSRLFTELYQRMIDKDKGGDLLFFVHGFHNDFPEVLDSVCELEAKYINKNSPIKHVVFFTWPAMGNLLRYRDDAKDAELSGYTLARCYLMLIDFFRTAFLPTPGKRDSFKACGHSMHLLAHSMGNRVVENMMVELYRQQGEKLTALFKEVILAASDVDWQVFEQPRAFYNLVNVCQRATVYFNTSDLALLVSETTKNAFNRLGKFGFRDFHKVPSHVYSVDCTGVGDQAGISNSLVQHWYYKESPKVVKDITEVLKGRNAEDFVGYTRNEIPGNASQYRLKK